MTTRYEEAAVWFFRESFAAVASHGNVAALAKLLERYANEVPRAAPDTVSTWHAIDHSDPPAYERIYEPIQLTKPINCIGSITCFRAGPCWMLIVNGRIVRQSELYEDGSSIAIVQADCDDFRDRVVAMWNAPRL